MNQSYQSLLSLNTMTSQIGFSDTSSKIQLFLSGRNLLDLDFFSKSDPFVQVYYKRSPLQKSILFGRTQTIQNQLNPNWKKTFILDYIFQTKQEITFQVYDQDMGQDKQFIGRVNTTIGALAGAKNQTTILELVNNQRKGQKPGKLIIRIQPSNQGSKFLKTKWRASKLINTDSWFDFWDKSDPYLKFLKIRGDNTLIQTCRTQVIQNDLNPNWKPIQLSVDKLISNQSSNGKFKLECWDWEEEGENKHQFIGETYLNIQDLMNVKKYPVQYKMNNPKHKKCGTLILENVETVVKPTFMDYLRGGLQLNLSIAIDFTGSNGIPTQPSSLHYISASRPNQYQIAIDAVARILLDYDSDKRIPAFGFGAKPHFNGLNSSIVSHCFPLSGNPNQIQAFGYQHLMSMYNIAIQNVQLSGPTYFSPILKQSISLARLCQQQSSSCYQILLILTDGQIHDMDQTINLLVQNCNLPLSIIIVGVGNAQFTNMVRLDGDDGLFATNGTKANRDIVQFVPFRQVGLSPDRLAQELLAELPKQVTDYMKMIGKMPGPSLDANIQQRIQQFQHPKPKIDQILKIQFANMMLINNQNLNPYETNKRY